MLRHRLKGEKWLHWLFLHHHHILYQLLVELIETDLVFCWHTNCKCAILFVFLWPFQHCDSHSMDNIFYLFSTGLRPQKSNNITQLDEFGVKQCENPTLVHSIFWVLLYLPFFVNNLFQPSKELWCIQYTHQQCHWLYSLPSLQVTFRMATVTWREVDDCMWALGGSQQIAARLPVEVTVILRGCHRVKLAQGRDVVLESTWLLFPVSQYHIWIGKLNAGVASMRLWSIISTEVGVIVICSSQK